MERKELTISPKDLYPTESFAFIKDERLQFYVSCFKSGKEVDKPCVFYFYENYYILKGHHIVLAAIMAEQEEITAEIVDITEFSFWKEEANVKHTLQSVGKSTLYDFELIGNFTYRSYPCFYEKDC